MISVDYIIDTIAKTNGNISPISPWNEPDNQFFLKVHVWVPHYSFVVDSGMNALLLMEEILHHQGCIKPCK